MVARLLALGAAIAMVVGSLVVRSRLDEGGGTATAELRLVCSTELAQACEELERQTGLQVRVEAAGATADRLVGDDAGGPASLDGWLVPAPWPEVVRGARQRGGLEPVLEPGPVLARSPMVLAVWPGRAAVLRQRCPPGQVTWRCWGDAAGQVKPGHAHPDEALGLITLGAATAGFLGRFDLARVDVEENDDFRAWLTRLERSVSTFQPTGGSALQDMLLKGPVDFDAVATSEAEAGPLLAASARPTKPELIYPAPVATVDVLLASVPGDRGRRLAATVGGEAGDDALARSGWRVNEQPLAPGVGPDPALPPTSGLPDAGVLDTLRALATEVRP